MDMALTRLEEEKSSTQCARSVRGFLLAFLVPCVLGALLAGFSFAVLISNNEQVGPVEAARIQHEQGGLYGSALYYRPYPYKLELYRLNRPDVAIVGSSRAMPFVRDGFAASEISLGGAVNEIAEGERLIPEMLAIHKPKLMIFTLDYWWFNEARVAEASEFSTSADTGFSLQDLIAPYRWIIKGDADFGALAATILRRPEGEPRLGAWATQNGAGFDAYGAEHYGAILTGARKHPDREFKATLKRLKNAKADSKTAASGAFSEAAWISLQHIAATLKAEGVEVRFVLPPIAGTVLKSMREGKGTSLLETLHARLVDSGLAFYDFTDGASVDSPDCEFVDGFHGGFVTYIRMLRTMAPDLESVPSLRGLVQPVDELDRLIAANSGRATLRDAAWSGPEVDYLGLGCRK
jgi:hypothetical protein